MAGSNIDWFVRADVRAGDGSRAAPFHDPWLAFRAASPGDVVHIAAGTYFGRYDRSSWLIDCPKLTVRGGYNADFSQRTPWQTPSVFAVFPGYEYPRENSLLSGGSDHDQLILDGLFFDAAGRNTYSDGPVAGLNSFPQMDGVIATFNAPQVTIKNCVFANSATGGVALSGDESRFENNLIINIIGLAMLDLRRTSSNVAPIVVQNNAFCFIHDVGQPCGGGGDRAIGVRSNRPAVVQDNVFVSCGNSAMVTLQDFARLRLDRNLFYLTPRNIVNTRLQGSEYELTEAILDELEDVGFESVAGNVIHDPGITGLKAGWLDAYSRHLLANYVKPPRDAANSLRTAAGLTPLVAADLQKPADQGALAPRLTPQEILAVHFTASQGFHPVDIPVDIAAQPPTVPVTYRAVEWSTIAEADASLANQPVELRVGLGFEQNSVLLADAPPETHMGIRIYQPPSDNGVFFVLAPRHTLVQRQYEDALKYNNGREVETEYLLRGIYRTDLTSTSRQKATLVAQSIAPAPMNTPAAVTRPVGRDWFVKAGSSGGDGTRDKPFRDPFQALEKAQAGDAIHVTTGEYAGKLRSGTWKLAVQYLSLLGGYAPDFTVRDPWENPTRFVLNEQEHAKGTPEGTILGSEEASDGLVLDGFIFDGSTYNTYAPDGSLQPGNSPRSPMVSLMGGNAPITVRNCVFVNAAYAAININCVAGVFENNIIVNTSGWSVKISANGLGPWLIRNNSILFATDPTQRAGTGMSSAEGTLLHITGRSAFAVDSNIFGFADNYGVRFTISQQSMSFDRNAFAGTLYLHLSDAKYLWADSATWARRAVADTDFASFSGNTLDLPKLPLAATFGDAVLRRLQGLPSRISNEQWKTLAAQVGSSVVPVVVSDTPSASAPKPEPVPAAAAPAAPSISDLLASLGSIKEQMKDVAAHKDAPEPSKPLYCPMLDWKAALALVQPPANSGPAGAHRVALSVSFGKG